MYGVVREFQDATGVTHAVRGRFGQASTAWGVVFARKTALELYVVRANHNTSRLELLQNTSVGSAIVSLAVLRRFSSAGDVLWLGFDDMRLVALTWEQDARAWVSEQIIRLGSLLGKELCSPTGIMNNADGVGPSCELLRGRAGSHGRPVIRSDPSGRCLAVLSPNQDLLYIVPTLGDDDSGTGSRIANVNDVFLIDLKSTYGASNVKDIVFLQGTFEPNILILHEPKRTWSGRAAALRNTSHVLAISIDVRSKRHSKTWVMDKLPYDSIKLEPVPESAGGGALVLAPNVLMQVRHGACVSGLSLNCFGDAYAAELKYQYECISKSDTLMALDAAHCRFLDCESHRATGSLQNTALLSLKGGELYFLTLTTGSNSVMQMQRAGSTVLASEIVPVNERFFILVSRLSDSLLVEYKRSSDDGVDENAKTDDEASNGIIQSSQNPQPDVKQQKSKKRRRTAEEEAEYEEIYGTKPPPESSDDEGDLGVGDFKGALELDDKDEGTRGVYDDDDELGWVFNTTADEENTSSSTAKAGRWALKVKDTIACFGPGTDFAVGPSPHATSRNVLDMVVAGGYAKNGCLAVVHQSVRPMDRTQFPLEGCEGAWTLQDPGIVERKAKAREARNRAIMLRNSDHRAINTKRHAARKRYVDEAKNQYFQKQLEERKVGKKSVYDEEVEDSNASSEDKKANQETEGSHEEIDQTAPLPSRATNGEMAYPQLERSSSEQNEGASTVKQELLGDNVLENDRLPKRLKVEDTILIGAQDSQKNQTASAGETLSVPDEVLQMIEAEAAAKYPLEAEEDLEESPGEESSFHAFMLLTTATSTVVILCTGNELEQLVDDDVKFITNQATLCAGNVLHGCAIVQITRTRVIVVKDSEVACEYVIPDESSPIRAAQVLDPLVLLLTEDGRVLVFTVAAEISSEPTSIPTEDLSSRVMDVDFDEYGMEITRSAGDRPGVSAANGTSPNDMQDPKLPRPEGEFSSAPNGSASQMHSLRNISLRQDFESENPLNSSEFANCACFYSGSLGVEVAKSGLPLPIQEKLQAQESQENTQKDASSANNEPESGGDAMKKEPGILPDTSTVGNMDEEERMLYGDSDGEEERMLYGESENDATKPENVHASSFSEHGTGTTGDATKFPNADSSQVVTTESKTAARVGLPQEKGVLPLPEGESESFGSLNALLVIVSKSGSLEIRSPALDYAVVLKCEHFFTAPSLVHDTANLIRATYRQKDVLRAPKNLQIVQIAMAEVRASTLIPGLSTSILVAISASGLPIIYTGYMSTLGRSSISTGPRSRLRFRRYVASDRSASIFARCIATTKKFSENISQTDSKSILTRLSISHFANVAGRTGLFVGGPYPFFIFAERGYPRLHAMYNSQGWKILSFAELHNINCPRGFVTVAEGGVVRIGELPAHSAVNLDAPSPMHKISLRCTPHKIAYHVGSATYGVLASMPTLTTREERLARILQSLEKHDKRHYQHTVAQAEAETGDERVNRVPPLYEELHELRVYRSDTWELIKSYKLQKGEVGLAIANMNVNVFKQRVASGAGDIPASHKGEDGNESLFAASLKLRPKNMLVVGTGHVNGEDATSRGRLLLFEVSRQEVFTESDNIYTAFQLQLIAEKELASPVTAVAAMEGYVICGVGPQISVYKLVGDEIVHLSFAFGQLLCTSISSLKQYVVAADMRKSVSFMYFRERNSSVNFLGKDFEHVTAYATEFLIRGADVSIIMSDGVGNIHALSYAHASIAASRGGKRLLAHGGVRIGSRINKFVRMRVPDREGAQEQGAGAHALAFATLDGGIGAIASVDQKLFEAIKSVAEGVVACASLPRYGGTHAEEVQRFAPECAGTELLDQRLCDGKAAVGFFELDLVRAWSVARTLGMDLAEVAQCIAQVDSVLEAFG